VAVPCRGDREARPLQVVADELDDLGLVVHDEDACHVRHGSRTGGSGRPSASVLEWSGLVRGRRAGSLPVLLVVPGPHVLIPPAVATELRVATAVVAPSAKAEGGAHQAEEDEQEE